MLLSSGVAAKPTDLPATALVITFSNEHAPQSIGQVKQFSIKYLIVWKLQSTKFAVRVEAKVIMFEETKILKLTESEHISCKFKLR